MSGVVHFRLRKIPYFAVEPHPFLASSKRFFRLSHFGATRKTMLLSVRGNCVGVMFATDAFAKGEQRWCGKRQKLSRTKPRSAPLSSPLLSSLLSPLSSPLSPLSWGSGAHQALSSPLLSSPLRSSPSPLLFSPRTVPRTVQPFIGVNRPTHPDSATWKGSPRVVPF